MKGMETILYLKRMKVYHGKLYSTLSEEKKCNVKVNQTFLETTLIATFEDFILSFLLCKWRKLQEILVQKRNLFGI